MKKTIKIILLILIVFNFKSIAQDTLVTKNEAIPIITLSDDDFNVDEQSQNISGLLQSSKDVFVNTAAYTFGPAHFRIRGYDSQYTNMLMNNISLNDMETGWAHWSVIGGLNDVLRNKDVKTGIVASRNFFSSIGGITNMDTRASKYGKSIKLTLSGSNRSYTNRIMLTASTGMMENNWAVTFSGSRRWANEGYIDGTFYDAWSYFLSVEKKINNQHSFGLVAFGAPNKHGKPGVSTQEAYDLAGSNYYNPYWGYQNGEKRNSRVSNYHKPVFIFSHYWNIDKKSTLTSSVAYSFSKGGSTALNWYDANDPRPDYYKKLPSYFQDDEFTFNKLTNLWQNSEDYRQIHWDNFYFANRKNLYTVNDVDGIEGNDFTGNRAKYIVEDRRNDNSQLSFNSLYNSEINDNIYITSGINANLYKGYHFKKISDLLGGEYWLDIDQFAERDFKDIELAQSDLRHPNNLVYEGDKFGYDYTANVNKVEAFAQSEFSYSKVDFYLAGSVSHTSFWRTGNMQNGKFPDNSYGDSEKQKYFNFALKSGATYKINGKNFISFNAAYLTNAPYFRNAFISARTRNDVIDNLSNEKILSGDINYIIRSPFIKSRLTFYYTKFIDQTWSRSFYHDEMRSFVNYIMTGVDKLHYGTELGIEVPLTSALTFTTVLTKNDFIYDSRPKVTISQDNNSEILVDNKTVYIKNNKIGSMPQTAGSVGLKYFSSKYWFCGINANFFSNMYLNINPDRRTLQAVEGLVSTDPQWEELMQQEKLDDAYTLDLFLGKSWKIKEYYINLNISVSNILDNTDFATGGFEQYRYEQKNINKFPPKYFYLYGRTFFVNLSFRI
ncbi:MAG: Plug domain-containing protein [Bacteroidales bacterium]|nr:Plug domain-containing protein [Bacteroidales bacterium]